MWTRFYLLEIASEKFAYIFNEHEGLRRWRVSDSLNRCGMKIRNRRLANLKLFTIEWTCINFPEHDSSINFPLLEKYQFLTEIEKYLFTERARNEIVEEIFVNYGKDFMDQKVSSFYREFDNFMLMGAEGFEIQGNQVSFLRNWLEQKS